MQKIVVLNRFLVAVLLLGSGLAACGTKEEPTSARASGPSAAGVYYDRDGYDRKKLSTGIGDPAALALQKSDDVISTGDKVATIPACAVVTVDDLKRVGKRLFVNSFATAIMRSYFDGVGRGPLGNPQQLPVGGEGNECAYALTGKSEPEFVTVNVYQPFMLATAVLDREIKSSWTRAPAGSVPDGVEVFEKSRNTTSTNSKSQQDTYLLRKGEVAVSLDFTLADDNRQADYDALMKAAVTNIARVQAKPVGTPTVHYDSPTFKNKILAAWGGFLDV
jgi:hypothetical protein